MDVVKPLEGRCWQCPWRLDIRNRMMVSSTNNVLSCEQSSILILPTELIFSTSTNFMSGRSHQSIERQFSPSVHGGALVHRVISRRHTAVGQLADFQGANDEHI